jgi:plastocyanin
MQIPVENPRSPVTSWARANFRRWLAPATALACLLVGSPTDAAGPTGRVVGRVRLVSVSASRPLATAYTSRWIPAQGQAPKEISNVVVYLQGVPPTPVAPRHYVLRQEGETFLPHVLPVARGSWVDFTNGDPFYHNVFSLSRAGTFDLGRFPRGQSRERQFSAPGLVKVYCHLHSDMSAVVMVLDHPWFATPQDDGEFVLTNVPAGRRTVTAWHERVGEAKTSVEVPAGGTATVEFELPVVEP